MKLQSVIPGDPNALLCTLSVSRVLGPMNFKLDFIQQAVRDSVDSGFAVSTLGNFLATKYTNIGWCWA